MFQLPLSLMLVVAAPQAELVVLLPTEVEPGIVNLSTTLLEEQLLVGMARVEGYRVLGLADINAMLAAEQRKDLLGCEDVSCLSTVSGALGAAWLARLTIHRPLEQRWSITAHLLKVGGREEARRITRQALGDRSVLFAAAPAVLRELLTGVSDPSLIADPQQPRTAALRPYLSAGGLRQYARYAAGRAEPLGLDAWVAQTNSESKALFWAEMILLTTAVCSYGLWGAGGESDFFAPVAIGSSVLLPWMLIVDGLDIGNIELSMPDRAPSPHLAM